MSEEKIYKIENIIQDPVDSRDYIFSNTSSNVSNYSLVKFVREIEDQGSIGSCVGNAGVSALELMCYKNGTHVNLSRLFAYYNVRFVDGRVGQEGAFLRSIFSSINRFGLPTEEEYPYIIEKQNQTPPQEIYDLAKKFIVSRYERVFLNQKASVKGAIDSGFPIVFGIDIKEDFYNIPSVLNADSYAAIGNSIGGHAMIIIGYDEKGVIVENSWGNQWGDKGLGAISWEILARDAYDGWVATEIKRVDDIPVPEPQVEDGIFAKIIAFFKSIWKQLFD
jgi:C1A family cysteine protease